MEGGETIRVGQVRVLPAPDRRLREEKAEHRPRLCRLRGYTRLRRGVAEPREEPLTRAHDSVPDVRLGERSKRLDPGGHRERVPRERPRLVNGSGGRDQLHDLAPAAIRTDGKPAADHLAERRSGPA